MPKQFHTKLAGVTMQNADGTSRQENIESLQPGDELDLIRQPENEHDPNAIAVFDNTANQVGYLNRSVAKEIAPEMDRGLHIECSVVEITGQGEDTLGVNVLIKVMTIEDALARHQSSVTPTPLRSTSKPVASSRNPFSSTISARKPFSSTRSPVTSEVHKVNPNPKSPKSIIILLVLWFTLGYIGGHRWYAGRGSWLYTLTLGWFTIGWIIDLFVIIFGRFEDNHGRQIRF